MARSPIRPAYRVVSLHEARLDPMLFMPEVANPQLRYQPRQDRGSGPDRE
jgi:hypothetical protein